MTNRRSLSGWPLLGPLVWAGLGLLALGNPSPALACEGEIKPALVSTDPPSTKPTPAEEPQPRESHAPHSPAPRYADLSPREWAELEQRSRDRQAILPYRFLAVPRCPSLTNQARVAFSQQDYDQALDDLGAAIAQAPNQPEHWLNRAMVHYYLGQDRAARSDAATAYLISRERSSHYDDSAVGQGYRALFLALDGKIPDPRQAIELAPPPASPTIVKPQER